MNLARFTICKRIISFLVTLCILSSFFIHAANDIIIYRKYNEERKIALTFDDGPHPKYTEQILDLLAQYGIKATFFVLGSQAQRYPEIIEREINDGHEIGNHTYSHLMKCTTPLDMYNEISAVQRLLYEKHGYTPTIFRPPGGIVGEGLIKSVADFDMKLIIWSIDTRDWAHTPSDEIVENIKTSIQSGDIILFHDFVSGENTTIPALKKIIPYLLDCGYKFVTISELLA